MAEYYPLISRAVAGLRTSTPEARQAIYDRAQQALVGQLRSMEPPVPEDAIEREVTALEEAVARVESDLAGSAPPPVSSAALAKPAPPPPLTAVQPDALPAAEKPPAAKPAASPYRPPPPIRPRAPRPPEPPPLGGLARPTPPRREAPVLAPRPAMPPGRPVAPRTAAPRVSPDKTAPVRPPPLAAEARTRPDRAAAEPERLDKPSEIPTPPGLPAAAKLDIDAPRAQPSALDRDEDAEIAPLREADGPRDMLDRREEASRPAAPRPIDRNRPNLRVWIVAIAALAAVIAIAFTAWRLRDDPQDLARVPAAVAVPEAAPGKIAERADGTDAAEAGKETAAAVAVPSPSETTTPAAANAAAGPAAPAAATAPAPTPAVPIAYKAAILIDAPDEPQKVKTYVGTVVWRTETVSQGQDQPIGTAIRADIDIPDAKIQAVMQFRRNTEAQFPASHTIELKFSPAADSPLGGIKQISVPQLRRDEMPTGDPLSGVPVTITDNYFLIGLTRGDAESRNIDLVKARNWFDIPMLLSNGKASKVTFEKGAAGDQIFNDVIQGWKAAQN